jgi:hypothetical protein
MKYLNAIKSALESFYENDSDLLQGRMHEMTFCFRIAKYLSELLEKGDKRIDCEYHSMVCDDEYVRKSIRNNKKRKNIRPDIIFHQRSSPNASGKNIFALEVKIGSPGKDLDKVQDIVLGLDYEYGFCISNVRKCSVTIYELRKDVIEKKYRYRIKKIATSQIVLEEII